MDMRLSSLGAGNSARRMADTVNGLSGVTLRAVASRQLDKAQAFGKKYGAETAFGSYEELYQDPDTDLIYIATPHSFHYEQAREALLHGKHVLCEKPMTINSKQAAELFELGREKGLFVSEAIWTRYLPLAEKLRELLEEKVIGEPRMMVVRYGFQCAGIPRMEEPELAGGALLDLGIYGLTVVSMIFGEDIIDIKSAGVLTDKGMDAHSATTLTFRNGRIAVVCTAMDATLGDQAVIYGENGRIELSPVCNWDGIRILDGSGTLIRHIPRPPQITGFDYEVQAAVEAIRAGQCETRQVPHATILRIMERMDQLRDSWGMKYPGED